MSFTQSLVESDVPAFHAATRVPFLRAAGQGRVSRRALSQWLSQNRIYSQAYIGFTGSLLAKVQLPHHFVHDHKESLEWSILDMLFGALGWIHRELRFFAETAARYGLHLEYPQGNSNNSFSSSHNNSIGSSLLSSHNNASSSTTATNQTTPTIPTPTIPRFEASPATRDYLALFASAADPRTTLLQGMVLLWATQRCYLDAWKYGRSQRPHTTTYADADGGALWDALIPNWTSPEFEKFVADIARYTDELARREGAQATDLIHNGVWQRVLQVERAFWPEVQF